MRHAGTRQTIALTSILLAMLILIPGAARAAGWLPAVSLNTTDGSGPSVAIDAPGNATMVWQANPGGGSIAAVQGAHHVVGTPGFSALADFSTDTANDNTAPLVVSNAAGDGLVIWVHATGFMANEEVLARTIGPGGTVGAVQPLTTAGGSYAGLAAAIDASGDVVIAWVHNGANVEAVTRQGLVGAFTAATLLDGTATSAPSVAIDGSGDAITVWPTALAIEAKRHPAGGSWTVTPDQVPDGGGHTYSSPVVGANPTGQMVVAFVDAFNSTTVAATTGAVSGGWGVSPTVTTLSQSGVTHGPAVNVDNGGGAAVGWSTGTAVQVSLRPAGGSFPSTTAVQSIAVPTPDAFAMGGNGAGDLVITWSMFDTSVLQNIVSAAVKPHSAGSFGAAQTISDPTTYASFPVVALDQAGDAVAGISLGATPAGISAAVYDASPPQLGTLTGPASVRSGTAAAFSVPAVDAFSAVSVSWSFGDGSPAVTGTTVSHAFKAAGTFTVQATATDAAGNAASATHSIVVSGAGGVNPPPPATVRCKVPKLKGKTLSQAKTLLKRAHCRAGKVHKPRARKHHKLRKLVVSRTSPAAHAIRRAGTKVGLTLAQVPKPRPKKHHK